MSQCIFECDLVVPVQRIERLLERLAAGRKALFHGVLDLIHFAIPYEIRYMRSIQHDLDSRNAPAVLGSNQTLRNYAPQAEGKIAKQRLARVAREEVDDSAERVIAVIRMQRRQA